MLVTNLLLCSCIFISATSLTSKVHNDKSVQKKIEMDPKVNEDAKKEKLIKWLSFHLQLYSGRRGKTESYVFYSS